MKNQDKVKSSILYLDAYSRLVGKGLKLDHTLMHVQREPTEVHVAADVEVHPLAESDQAVVEDLVGLGGILKCWYPEARYGNNFEHEITRRVMETIVRSLSVT